MRIRRRVASRSVKLAGAAVVLSLGLGAAVPMTVAAWNSTATFDAGVRTGTIALLGSTDGVTWVDGRKILIDNFELEEGMTKDVTLQIQNGGTKTMRVTSATLSLEGEIFAGAQPATVAIDDKDLIGYQLVPGQKQQVTLNVRTPADWSSAYMGKTATLGLAIQGESSKTVCAPVATPAGAAPNLGLPGKMIGTSLANFPQNSGVVTGIQTLFGRKPNSAVVYDNVGTSSYQSPTGAIQTGASHGMVTTVTLQIRNSASAANDPLFTLARIADGAHDAKICQFAQEIATAGRPTIVRFLQEMNSTVFPWGAGVNGNTEADYVRAYRHVHDVFKQAGATNASLSWNVNSTKLSALTLANYYPGDRYVDVVGADVYSQANSAVAADVYDETLNSIRALTKKPVMLTETAALAGPNKAAFITSMFSYLNSSPDLIGLNWMQSTTFPYAIDPGTAEETAFRAGMAATTLKSFPVIPLP